LLLALPPFLTLPDLFPPPREEKRREMGFTDLVSQTGLTALDAWVGDKSYIAG